MRSRSLAVTVLLVASAPRADPASLSPREPLDAAEIGALGADGDVWRAPELEAVIDGRWARRSRFPAGLPPPGLESELVAALGALSRLDPSAAARRAAIVLESGASLELRRAARRALGATGELGAVRRELVDYFADPLGARAALARAEAATADVRLRDFIETPEAEPVAAGPSPRSLVERNLATMRGARATRALLASGAPSRVLGALASGALDRDVERALRLGLGSRDEGEVLDALAALGARRALDPRDAERLLDDERVAVKALAARLGGDARVLRSRIADDAREPFFSEAVATLVRLEGAAGARELAPLVEGRGFRATLSILDALGAGDVPLARRLVLAIPKSDRGRLLEALAETDRRVLAEIPMSPDDVDRLYPYLASSRHAVLRERLSLADRARGKALASGLLSTRASEEEKRSLVGAMADAWAGAIAAGGQPVVEGLEALAGTEALDRFVAESPVDEKLLAALAVLPTPRARLRLQAIGSAEAVPRILERSDRVLALPALTALASSSGGASSEAAKLALLRLGGAGSNAFLRAALASGPSEDLLAAVMDSPLEPRLVEATLEPMASRPAPAPAALAALYGFHERYPARFLTLAAVETGALGERVSFVLSLSGDRKRVPLLVDRAVGLAPAASQEAALLGLAERDLGAFDQRLHRLAGSGDRRVRFLAAAALVPSGEAWSMRLLMGELDETDPFERRRAALALSRLDDDRARELLQMMVDDGTAEPFTLIALLDRSGGELDGDRAFQRRAWALVAEGVARGDALAVLAASRLDEPAAIAAVVSWLKAR